MEQKKMEKRRQEKTKSRLDVKSGYVKDNIN